MIADGTGRRRGFLQTAASTAAVVLSGCAPTAVRRGGSVEPGSSPKEAEVTPGEDLMQEHGVLERILLVYDEAVVRIERGEVIDLGVVDRAAGIVRGFVEDYHEKLEERFVFPRLESARRELELVAVLRRQHERGREVTDDIVRSVSSATATPQLAEMLRGFTRMYRPHAAREDTVLFPAFREVIGGAAYRELGEQFEEQEHERFGERGFADVVGEVTKLETALGIHDLASFTPR